MGAYEVLGLFLPGILMLLSAPIVARVRKRSERLSSLALESHSFAYAAVMLVTMGASLALVVLLNASYMDWLRIAALLQIPVLVQGWITAFTLPLGHRLIRKPQDVAIALLDRFPDLKNVTKIFVDEPRRRVTWTFVDHSGCEHSFSMRIPVDNIVYESSQVGKFPSSLTVRDLVGEHGESHHRIPES